MAPAPEVAWLDAGLSPDAALSGSAQAVGDLARPGLAVPES
jgi:hypothetical protein